MRQGKGVARGEQTIQPLFPLSFPISSHLVSFPDKGPFFLISQSQATWPEEELEWMATTSFNHAIDCYSAHETERAKEWASKAINLAHYCHDGRLEEILQSKYLRLSFDEGSG